MGLQRTEARRAREWVSHTLWCSGRVLIICCFNLWAKWYSSHLNCSQQRGSADLTETQSRLGSLPCSACNMSAVLTALPGGFLCSRELALCRQLLAGLATRANLPGIAGKTDSFSLRKTAKTQILPTYIYKLERKPYWKNCLLLTCPYSDYVSS